MVTVKSNRAASVAYVLSSRAASVGKSGVCICATGIRARSHAHGDLGRRFPAVSVLRITIALPERWIDSVQSLSPRNLVWL